MELSWVTFLLAALLGTTLVGMSPYIYNTYIADFTRDRDTENAILRPVADAEYSPRKFTRECGVITNLASTIGCDLCKLLFSGLQFLVNRNSSGEDIVHFTTYLCKEFNVETDRICDAITKQFKDEVIGVATKLVLSPEEACGVLLGHNCGTPYDPSSSWNVTFPKIPKPPVVEPKPPKDKRTENWTYDALGDYQSSSSDTGLPGSPVLRVLHISDIHTDPLYQPGSKSKCGEPLCCRANDGKPEPGQPAAGKWGSLLNCDVPNNLVENFFQHLYSIKDQYDYVLFTGDLPPHNVWNQSHDDQIKSLQAFTQLALKYLPDKKVYCTLGNHESAPVNSFPPNFIKGTQSINWLYSKIADSWLNWLPNDTRQTIESGGYYTVKLADKFRLISLNMNYCNNGNWWLLINTTDPNGQLQWLIKTLQLAENNKEKVHIIGHIHPGGDSCLKYWSWNYYKIVNRYESTIVGQFFGHSHADWFEVFYDDVKFSRPTSVVYIPGSVTTYVDLNPGFRIYTVDGFYNTSSWAVLDFENYYMNITDANLSDKPQWKLEYKAKNEYSMKGLYPKDWSDLIERMKTNDTLFQMFHNHYSKLASDTACTGACKSDLLCDLRSGRSHDRQHLCQDIYL